MQRNVQLFLQFSPSSFCLSSTFWRSGGCEGTRHRQRAQHGLQQLRLRLRSQPPGQNYQGRKEGGLLPEDATLSECFARRLAPPLFLPAASSYHKVLAVAQPDKADAGRAEADAARPDV
jgi:hypothetical protein